MTDKKLTDNEIIEALECCADWCGAISCWDCPLKDTGCIHFDKLKDVLDLINRQKAEIERLERLLDKADKDYTRCAKRFFKEGVKEFAENAKDELYDWVGAGKSISYSRITKVIDNLVKEMVGEEND